MSKEHTIVVGVDGSRAAWAALDWAGEHAQLTGRTVQVVHVGDVFTMPGGVTDQPFGRDLLDEAVATLAENRPQVVMTTQLLPGDPAEVLIELSAASDIVAVGRGRDGIAGVLLGSVADRVLQHAHCPTAVVSRGARVGANTIAVGASETDGGRAALRFAFEEAARRKAEVVVVRAWLTYEWRSDGPIPRMANVDAWQAQERTYLAELLQPLREAFPEVPVRLVVTHESTEIALEREAHDAAMLVLGCRRTDETHLSRIGATTSWATHHVECPVVVVGHAKAATGTGDVQEAAQAAAGKTQTD